MKFFYLILFILSGNISLQAYSKKIILGTFDNVKDANMLLNKAGTILKSKIFHNFSADNNFTAYVRTSGKYYILVIEPIKSKVLLDEIVSLVKPSFTDAFVKEYVLADIHMSVVPQNTLVSKHIASDKNISILPQNTFVNEHMVPDKNVSVTSEDDNNKTIQLVIIRNDEKLIANNNKALPNIDKKINNNMEYDLAKQLFESQKYEEAYTLLKKLFLNDLSNPNINFYLGQSAYMLKKYEEALSAYERIIIVNEKAYRVKLEMAICYQQLGLLKEAKAMLMNVRDKVPKNVQKNIDIYLAAIEEKRKKHSLNGAVIFGLNYDSNIYGVTVDNVISDKIPNYTLNNTSSAGWAHQEVVAANYTYAKSETVKYKADLVVFDKSIFSYHDMDLFLVQITPALSVSYTKELVVDYAVFVNKIWLSSKPLMSNFGIYPKIKYIFSPTWMIDGAFKFQSQQNDAPNQNRDNNTYTLELGIQNIYTKELTFGIKTKANIVREKTNAEIGDLNEVAYNLYELTLNANYKYTPKIIIAPKLQIYQKNYIEHSISPLSGLELYKRTDKEYQMWLSGTYVYNPKMLLTLEYTHVIHDSNYADNRFNKDTLSANVIVPF